MYTIWGGVWEAWSAALRVAKRKFWHISAKMSSSPSHAASRAPAGPEEFSRYL